MMLAVEPQLLSELEDELEEEDEFGSAGNYEWESDISSVPITETEARLTPHCPAPTRATVSGFSRYSNSVSLLPPNEQAKLRKIATLIIGSFRPGCRPIRTVLLLGHADKDLQRERREPGYMTKISRERALAVKQALERLINNEALSPRIAWSIRGAGASQLVVPNPTSEQARRRNRRVEIILNPKQTIVQWVVAKAGLIGPHNLIDSRIDVGVRQVILRMARGTPRQRVDALGMLAAVKSGRLRGIFGNDLQAGTEIAAQLGTVRSRLIPPGQDAVLLSADRARPPTIIFREQLRSAPSRLESALRRAFINFRKMVGYRAMARTASGPILLHRQPDPGRLLMDPVPAAWYCAFICALCAALILDEVPFDEVPVCVVCINSCIKGTG